MAQLGTSSKDYTSYCRDTYTLVFIAALFTIAREWNQSRCSSSDAFQSPESHQQGAWVGEAVSRAEALHASPVAIDFPADIFFRQYYGFAHH